MYEVDRVALFTFSMSPLELFVRGSVIYLFVFHIFRFILCRDVGTFVIADAAQNAMGNDYESVPGGMVLISTIVC